MKIAIPKSDAKIYCFLAIFVIVLMFFVSPDSYTHDLFDRTDSTIFFMAGKAWMNSMIPYSDFTDTKGPLLWLIYGIGYLLSHTDYIGIFWISCLFVFFSYALTYKIAHLFLSRQLSVVCSIAMTLVYFNPAINYEIRCEDFCMPFVLLALYRTCLHLYQDHKSFYLSSFLIGLSIGATTMMKYSIAIDLCVVLPFVLYECPKSGFRVFRCLASIAGGFLLVVIPFVAYFLAQGCFNDFINGYFVFALQTIDHSQGTLRIIFYKLTANSETLAWLLLAVTTPLYIPYLTRYRYFPLIASFWFAIVTFQNAVYPYYYSCCAPFMIFLFISLLWLVHFFAHHTDIHLQHSYTYTFLFSILILALTIFNNLGFYYFNQQSNDKSQHLRNLFLQASVNNIPSISYHKYANIMRNKEKPKVLYLHSLETHGFEVPTNGLPACKYWFLPNGSTPNIVAEQEEACMKGIPDYIFVPTTDRKGQSFLEYLGYRRYYCKDIDFTMYINPENGKR
jgi:hypothetical protein